MTIFCVAIICSSRCLLIPSESLLCVLKETTTDCVVVENVLISKFIQFGKTVVAQ